MKCPQCKVTDLDIKSGQYYCPWDNKFFGAATVAKKTENQINPTIAKLDSLASTKLGALNSVDYDNPINRYYFLKIFLILVLISGYWLIGFWGSYLSLNPFCSIQIERTYGRSDKELFEALKVLKNDNPQIYQRICSEFKEIILQPCLYSGEKPPYRYNNYCVLRNRKVAYIDPTFSQQESLFEQHPQNTPKQIAAVLTYLLDKR